MYDLLYVTPPPTSGNRLSLVGSYLYGNTVRCQQWDKRSGVRSYESYTVKVVPCHSRAAHFASVTVRDLRGTELNTLERLDQIMVLL